MTTNSEKDSQNNKSEKRPNKWKQAICGLFGEMIGQLILLLLFFAVANIYAAYVFFWFWCIFFDFTFRYVDLLRMEKMAEESVIF
ncbi:hypothetical protein SAMN05421749_102326 [Acinetobacter marinus]|uniref:Uncharacterized protein n=1 Tax=Acinetobacter marinus TaxID=281375 RepID=A0A1G6HJH0_9GAMM|nr:hypothetical protein [Acinetobacter marinus]SDB94400.1 hypothetical protein SAMN05421749_102326 [Acinetobacter marinus]